MGGVALFVYGTLMDEERLEQLTSRRFSRQRAALEGFARVVAAHGYPTIVPQAGARVEGVLVEDVDAASLAALDVYEDAGRLYARRPAEVLVDGERVPCAGEHRVEHRPRELPRERVLLTRVVGGEEHEPRRQAVLRPVCEARQRARQRRAAGALGGEEAVVRHLAERDRDPESRQERELAQQPATAGRDLGRRGAVRGRGAAHDRGDERVAQPEPVVALARDGLAREAGAVERGVEPVAALVAGEHAPGPVGAVRCRRESDDEESRRRVAESRHGPGPVRPGAEARDLLPPHPLAVLDETRAEPAARQAPLEPEECLGVRGLYSAQRTPAVRKSACVSRTVPAHTCPSPAGSIARTAIVWRTGVVASGGA